MLHSHNACVAWHIPHVVRAEFPTQVRLRARVKKLQIALYIEYVRFRPQKILISLEIARDALEYPRIISQLARASHSDSKEGNCFAAEL